MHAHPVAPIAQGGRLAADWYTTKAVVGTEVATFPELESEMEKFGDQHRPCRVRVEPAKQRPAGFMRWFFDYACANKTNSLFP